MGTSNGVSRETFAGGETQTDRERAHRPLKLVRFTISNKNRAGCSTDNH